LLRQLYQDHLDRRTELEERLEEVTGKDGVVRRYVRTPPGSLTWGTAA
jgi:hypothetical protein